MQAPRVKHLVLAALIGLSTVGTSLVAPVAGTAHARGGTVWVYGWSVWTTSVGWHWYRSSCEGQNGQFRWTNTRTVRWWWWTYTEYKGDCYHMAYQSAPPM
jgi:hypothetical protein